jgi:hydroxylamine reductase
MEEALFKTLTNVDFSVEDTWNTLMRAGMINLKVMQMLDAGNTEHFGFPTPTKVHTGTVRGPGILVTGHDLLDLESLLEQTQGTGVNVYTHGEMLPANAYPKLNKYKNLIGNYGGAWQKQKKDFEEFGGPVLVTTNCVLIPPETYKDRLYTTSVASVPGVKHIADRKDFSEIIKHAQRIGDLPERKGPDVWTGAHHKAVLSLAPQIVDAVTTATRMAVKYTLQWDGKDNAGKPVRAGTYTVCIEASREHGTYQIIRQDMDFSGTPQHAALPGGTEISAANLDYQQVGR